MDAGKFIERIRAAGFKIKADGRELVITPAAKLTAEQTAFIQQHADAIHAALMPLPAPWGMIRERIQAGWRAQFAAPGPDGNQEITWLAPGEWEVDCAA